MAKTGFSLPKLLAWAAGLGLVLIAAAGIALKTLLPPEKVKQLVVARASAALHREIRLSGVSVGVFSGLTLDGLEVSENPDFAAGKFLAVDEFVLKVELMPLLKKKVVIDEISVVHPLIIVAKDKKGKFNFDDLTAPAPTDQKVAGKTAASAASSPLALELNVRKASVSAGRIEYTDKGTGTSVNVEAIQAAASSLDFDQASGSLSVILDKFSAGVSGFEMSLAGSVKLDPKKFDAPDLHGRFGDGDLKVSVSALDYLKAPDITLNASLSSLDLDRLMAVKQAAMGAGGSGAAASGKKAAAPAVPPAPAAAGGPAMKTRGQAVIGKMTYSNAKLNETQISWELSGLTPDFRSLAGWAKLHVAGGTFTSGQQSGRNGIMKALMMPMTILQSVGKLVASLKIVPDFSSLLFAEVVGDYTFAHGVMVIRDFHMTSAAAGVKTTGTIDLGAQRLNLAATIAPVNLVPIEVDVTGTFDNPSKKVRLDKILTAPAKDLRDTAGRILRGLFGH